MLARDGWKPRAVAGSGTVTPLLNVTPLYVRCRIVVGTTFSLLYWPYCIWQEGRRLLVHSQVFEALISRGFDVRDNMLDVVCLRVKSR